MHHLLLADFKKFLMTCAASVGLAPTPTPEPAGTRRAPMADKRRAPAAGADYRATARKKTASWLDHRRLASHDAVSNQLDEIAAEAVQAADDEGILSWHRDVNSWLRRKAKELAIQAILTASPGHLEYYEEARIYVEDNFPNARLVDASAVAREVAALAVIKNLRVTHPNPTAYLKKTARHLALVNLRGWDRDNQRTKDFEKQSMLLRSDMHASFRELALEAEASGLQVRRIAKEEFDRLEPATRIVLIGDRERMRNNKSWAEAASRYTMSDGKPMAWDAYLNWTDSAWREWLEAVLHRFAEELDAP